ncbi:MAG: DNA-binding PadR family transcriptional regulator [Ilumatobacter sp.]|jgi:DNA-binding PadR family transcriptional regulator
MSVTQTFLGLLDRGPQHGYGLKVAYDELFSVGKELRFGQVYATLSRLDRDGLAIVVAVEAGDGPERKVYEITPNGVAELESWLATPERTDKLTLAPIFAKVVVSLSTGRSASEVLEAQREVHTARMRELRAVAADGGFEHQIAVDLLIGHLQADLDWIELVGARLERLPDISAGYIASLRKDTS